MSELKLLKQRIRKLEAENTEMPDFKKKISEFDVKRAKLKCRIAEVLRVNKKYNERHNAENAKLKARIKKLESENVKFRDRIIKVKQKQMLNDNSSKNSSSSFNSDILLPKESILEVLFANIPNSQLKQCKPICKINNVISKILISFKTLKKREIDAFLDNMNKKKISNEIRQRK